MKFNHKIIAILILLFMCTTFSITYADPKSSAEPTPPSQSVDTDEESSSDIPTIQAEGAILIDEVTGKVLYAKNKDKHFYPASTTKILTALCHENGDLDDIVIVSQEVILYNGMVR